MVRISKQSCDGPVVSTEWSAAPPLLGGAVAAACVALHQWDANSFRPASLPLEQTAECAIMRYALPYGRVEPVADGLLPWAIGSEVCSLAAVPNLTQLKYTRWHMFRVWQPDLHLTLHACPWVGRSQQFPHAGKATQKESRAECAAARAAYAVHANQEQPWPARYHT